ncbi:hypothetical protein FSZ31_07875 [Sphingorhabdus soli]|uniref:Uncharacterized protein n=1 Tax=Flavisphingopyxis soli TaxID=2601267 RepID=A0A5C6U7T6_9SPHN|nr:hypothetical protein [Sphingorhabdus soli]TXC68874.1 hypothetical protein FSZ31_07875 [Sphingorhabdus soli]
MTSAPSVNSSRRRRLALGLSGVALIALSLSGPVASQESLLPPGFGETPAPTPAPAPRPAPAPTPSAPSNPGTTPAPSPATSEDVSGETGTDEGDQSDVPAAVRYDLPPSARRSLDQFGPLGTDVGGLAPDAFGASGGEYLSILMRETQAPIASRWASILLRRTLLSDVATPATINGADWAAARASLLLRMGDARGAQAIVQSIDSDNATPRLLNVALGTAMANADPAGLCPLVDQGLSKTKDKRWEVARSMCAAMAGEAGIASSTIDRLRRREGETIDILLAQRIVGAGAAGRRSVTVQWDNVDKLDGWRFGLATAAGLDIPDRLTQNFNARMRAWRMAAAMTPIDARVSDAKAAASIGILSNRAYGDLIGFAARSGDRGEATLALADDLRTAFADRRTANRLAALRDIWGDDAHGNAYGAYVLTARAAATMPVSGDYGDDAAPLIASMLTGGFDTVAARWAKALDEGSPAWAMVALAAPNGGIVSSGSIDSFSGDDKSAEQLATRFLVAGLAGLGRIDDGTASKWAQDLALDLGQQTRWSRAIDAAASRGEPGTVAVLTAVGMQGRGWDKVSPRHLFHIVRALRQVGLEPEARMIAAEAIARS